MAEKKHTKLSPSNASRWWNCPGSVALCEGIPEPEQSAHASDGEAAHELLERCLRPIASNPDPDIYERRDDVPKQTLNPYDFVGEEIRTERGVVVVTEEMADAVSFMIDEVKAELQKYKNPILLIEHKVDIAPGIGGTLDICIVEPYKLITVMDFKYGKGVIVSAVDNHQMLQYLLPVWEKYEPEKARLVIGQPRTEGQISIWDVPDGYLDTYRAELDRHIAMTKEENAPLQDGSHCRWCRGQAVCPKIREGLCKELTPIGNRELIFPDVALLPMETIVMILNVRDRLDSWLDAVAAYAQNILEQGGEVPGYELAKKRANREWRNETEAAAAFADLGDKRFQVKLKSPAQMEKIAGKERVAELVVVPDNGSTMKRKTEKGGDEKSKKNSKSKKGKTDVIDISVLE